MIPCLKELNKLDASEEAEPRKLEVSSLAVLFFNGRIHFALSMLSPDELGLITFY